MLEGFLNKEFAQKAKEMGRKIKEYSGEKIVIIHHNDADGICSGALLSKLCDLLGFESELICIEKVHPAIVDIIHERNSGNLVIYTDLAGLAAKMIDEVNKGRCKVWIIDHHPARAIKSRDVFVFDPELFGIGGDMFVSASTLNYILGSSIHKGMKRYAYLAVTGAVGDYHDRTGGVLGLDRFALDEAVSLKQVKIKIEGHKERYFVKFFDEFADVASDRLTTLGAVGYEKKGYRLGVKACLEGFNRKTVHEAEKLKTMRERKFNREIKRLKEGGLKMEEHTQWFHVEDRFSPMGVKTVGTFCQKIKDMSFIDEEKYLIGFQNCSKRIPDLGKVNWNLVKMSGRAPLPLERKIFKGEAIGFNFLVPKASEAVGGVADATHTIAAATLIEKGKEKEFIRAFEGLLEKQK